MKKLGLILMLILFVCIVAFCSCDSRVGGNSPHLSETSDVSPTTTAIVPLDANMWVGRPYDFVKNELEAVGFTNVRTERIESLSPIDADRLYTVQSVSVGGKTDFIKGQAFDRNDEVLISYLAYKKCDVTICVEFVCDDAAATNTCEVNFLNGLDKGTVEQGTVKTFRFAVDPGEYDTTFESAAAPFLRGEVTLPVDCNIEASYQIFCCDDRISVETVYVDRLTAPGNGEVKADAGAYAYKNKNYQEVETALRTLGFTNIQYRTLYDVVGEQAVLGNVDSVSIAGDSDFRRGDVFSVDAEVIIAYHMSKADNPANITMSKDLSAYIGMNYIEAKQEFLSMGFTDIELKEVKTENALYEDGAIVFAEIADGVFQSGDFFSPDDKVSIRYYSVAEPDPAEKVFYSTNNYGAARKGNTGVFSYKQSEALCDNYWIIDFDAGYVYWFTEGNGALTCGKTGMISGSLNDKMTATWYEGEDQGNWYFQFKQQNCPQTLVVMCDFGLAAEFEATDLKEALRCRATKTVRDYSEREADMDTEDVMIGGDGENNEPETDDVTASVGESMVWIPASGSKYHAKSNCSNMKSPQQVSLEYAQQQGYSPCQRCH